MGDGTGWSMDGCGIDSSANTSTANELECVRVKVNLRGLGLGSSESAGGTERDEVEPLSEAMVGGLELVVAVDTIDFLQHWLTCETSALYFASSVSREEGWLAFFDLKYATVSRNNLLGASSKLVSGVWPTSEPCTASFTYPFAPEEVPSVRTSSLLNNVRHSASSGAPGATSRAWSPFWTRVSAVTLLRCGGAAFWAIFRS